MGAKSLVLADKEPERLQFFVAECNDHMIWLPGDPISTNQLVSQAKYSGLLRLPNNPVQAFDFLFHSPLTQELISEQHQEIAIRGGFHFNNL